jgi:hypothetical protein
MGMWVAIAFLVPLRLGTIPSLLFTFHPVLPLWAKLRKEPTSCKCVASLSFFSFVRWTISSGVEREGII